MKKKILLNFIILLLFGIILTGCKNQGESVLVDSISISKKNLYLAEGQTAQISAQVYPFNADNQNYEFVSSNNSVVTIDNGFVKAIKAGNATISAISEDGGYKDSCNVLVTTVKNNLALNNYNNMNMPMNINYQKEFDKENAKTSKNDKNEQKNAQNLSKNSKKTANSQNFIKVSETDIAENIDQKTTAKQILEEIKTKTIQEMNVGFDAGKNVFDQIKNDFNVTINNIKNQSIDICNNFLQDTKQETDNSINSFFDLQTEIFESIQNINNQINQSIQNFKTEMIEQIDNIEQNIDSDDYVVETKDINGVKFVVITNKSNQ